MIHATRPFIVNERIKTKISGYEVSGTVEVSLQDLTVKYVAYIKQTKSSCSQTDLFSYLW